MAWRKKMEIRKENKFKNFFKRYGAITLAGVFTVAIALTIALTVTDKGSEVSTTNLDFQVPMNNAEILKDYSDTDLQFNEVLNRWEIHLGIDFTSQDTAVFSVLDGAVTSVSNNSLEGNVVEITHSNGFVSVYSSLADELLVSEGDTVQKGTQIGNASNTAGREVEEGNQLHFVLLLNGEEVDPNNYLDLQNK